MPNARLCYVGDGEDRSALEARVRALGFESCVQVTGFIPPERVASILNASDLYLVGSHREGWPTALLEAEACGLPVVVTDVSGASTLVQEGRNGFIVRSREPREFAAAIQSALKLQIPNPVSLAIAQRYALDNFRSDLAELWEPFRARPSTGTGVPR
jgi:glycosyltransferase involved in cell wall biosynthesis